MERQIRQQQQMTLDRQSEGKPYRWRDYHPPLRFHPTTWLQSLDDTPGEMFVTTQTKNVELRKRITTYMFTKNDDLSPDPPKWDISSVYEHLPPEDLQFVSTFDFSRKANFQAKISGISDANFVAKFLNKAGDDSESSGGDGSYDSDEDEDYATDQVFEKRLWPWIFRGPRRDLWQSSSHPKANHKLASNIVRQELEFQRDLLAILDDQVSMAPKAKNKLKQIDVRQEFTSHYQRYLLATLNDSVS